MRLTDLDILGITHEVGLAIEDPTKDWYEFLLTILSTKIDASKNELATIIRRRAYLTDALTYIQYGNPEHILIVKSDAKEMSSKSQPP